MDERFSGGDDNFRDCFGLLYVVLLACAWKRVEFACLAFLQDDFQVIVK